MFHIEYAVDHQFQCLLEIQLLVLLIVIVYCQSKISETDTWLLYSLEQGEISLFLHWIILHTLFLLVVCLSYIPPQQGR